MAQLHSNRWSDIAVFLTFFEAFFCKFSDPHVFSRSGIKVTEGFSIISNLMLLHYNDKLFQSEFFSRAKFFSHLLVFSQVFKVLYQKCINVGLLILGFIELLDYAPVMRTFIRKLKH